MAASAVAAASIVVPSSDRDTVASASPVTVTVAACALDSIVLMIASRLIPDTSVPATVVPGTATSE